MRSLTHLGSVRLMRAEKAGALERSACDLLIVGGPTQRYGVSPALQAWLERLPPGARLVVAPESFFMQRDVPSQGEKPRLERERLEPGEERRATEWAACQPGAAR